MFGLLCPAYGLTPRLQHWVTAHYRRASNYWMLLEVFDDVILNHRFQLVCRTCALLDEALVKERKAGRDIA